MCRHCAAPQSHAHGRRYGTDGKHIGYVTTTSGHVVCACAARTFSSTGSVYRPRVKGGGCSSSSPAKASAIRDVRPGEPCIGDEVRSRSGVENLLPPAPSPREVPPLVLLPRRPDPRSAGWFLNSSLGATRLRMRHFLYRTSKGLRKHTRSKSMQRKASPPRAPPAIAPVWEAEDERKQCRPGCKIPAIARVGDMVGL